ncbi:PfkB family carbohydrate kinase [Microbacterium sp. A204]|uniref:PfkB family carbohydrate kinase n=1 Tax=Microbacterium sp. A204 TaxID=3457321 RepID=UPI003FD3CBA8
MTSPAIDVAVVGDNTIDRFLDEPELGDLIGGNALNVAVQLSMLGLRVAYFGAVGTDANAEIVRRAAEARNVDVSGMIVSPGSTALTTIRRDTSGDRRFESEDFGVTAHYVPDDEVLQRIASARWVHVGMLPGGREFGERLKSISDVALSQDCSVSPDWHRLTVLFASAGEDEAEAERIIERGIAASSDVAVATLGSRGAQARSAESSWRVPATSVQVTDTTGAGDSFMAGFIAGRLRGESIGRALQSGVSRGAFTCQYMGGWPQLRADIERFG